MRDYEQLGLFDDFLTEYKITKPIRLISFFSGIEAQFKALKYLGDTLNISVESYKTCEWAYNSIVACNSIHNRDFTDYSEGKTKEEMIERIRGISTDYNNPLTDEQLTKKPLKWIQTAYNSCVANHNLINIMNVKGEDLEIVDVDKFEYILTYSFPCQDLSLAGLRAGMDTSQADGGTRSGLLWEVERILNECERLPQILIMENVPQIHSEKDMPNFRKWILALEKMGYNNYFTDLNSKDYGIPQNRERCFMVSILGREYNYKFPLPFKRELCLKDMLEDEVDEKYYLSQKMIDCLTGIKQKECKYDRSARFLSALKMTNKDNIAGCITTLAGSRATDNFVTDENTYDILLQQGYSFQNSKENNGIVSPNYGRAALNETIEKHTEEIQDGTFIDAYNKSVNNEIAGTITTRVNDANNTFISCYEKQTTNIPLKRGYSVSVKEESEDLVDGVDVLGSYSKSNFNQTPVVGKQGIAPTFTENHGEVIAVLEEEKGLESTNLSNSILIRENTKDGFKEATIGDGINISSRMHHQRGNVQKGMAQTLKTVCEVGVVVEDDRNMKEELCDYLINNNLVKEGDVVNHSFSGSRMENPTIANKEYNDCSPTLTTRPDTLGVAVSETVFTETEAQLFTKDGNVRRYIGSEKIDNFSEGDMATTTFPNGYGHGPRTHKDLSITLNTIDRPVVKKNLRIRKLTPKEAMRLMGFQDIDTEHLREIGMADAGIFHMAGDSIVVTCLLGIFAKLCGLDHFETEKVIKNYIKTIKEK